MASDSKFPRPVQRLDALASALKQKLDNEAAVLETLVAAAIKGQGQPDLWDLLHTAAVRDERLAELAFAYERLCQEKRMRTLPQAAQAEVLMSAGSFFAEVFGDADGALSYLERVLVIAPTHEQAFARIEAILSGRQDGLRLSDLYAAQAPHQSGNEAKLTMLRRALELADGFAKDVEDERGFSLCQQILGFDPQDSATRASLESRYERAGRWADLARLSEQTLASDRAPSADEAIELRSRLIDLYSGKLHEIERAMPHVEAVLEQDAGHSAARRVAAELLTHKAMAVRAAAALEGSFMHLRKWAQAARMLGTQVELLRGGKRLEAQKRLATLRFDKLGDLQGAFMLYEAIVTGDPADDEGRERLKKIAAAIDKRLDATRVMSRAASGVKEPALRARIQAELGELYLGLGDAKKARSIFQGILDTGGNDDAVLQAAIALVGLFTESNELRALATVLEKLTEIEPVAVARVAASERLAKLYEDELGDAPAAIATWSTLLDTPREPKALQSLERLYEATGDYAACIAMIERRAAKEKKEKEAKALWFRAGELRATKTTERVKALEAWEAFIAKYGASREAHAHALPLLEKERRFQELSAMLEAEAAMCPDEERAAVLGRLAQVRLSKLHQPDLAFEAYRQALALDPTERASRLAVEKLLTSPTPPVSAEQRLAAADVLEPIFRKDASMAGLARVLEVRADLAESPGQALRALEEAATIAEVDLGDRKRALDLSGRGLCEATTSQIEAVGAWLDRIDRLGTSGIDAAKRASVLVAALESKEIVHPAIADLARRAGEALAASGDVVQALSVYRRALAYEPSSAELLSRVDALLKEQGSPAERIALYREALDQEPKATPRRRELLHAIGAIERRDLGDVDAAIATYRRALEEDASDRTAYDALLEAHEAREAWDALYDELSRGRSRESGAPLAAIELRMAEVAALCGAPEKAMAHYRDLLASGAPLGEAVLDTIEQLADGEKNADLLIQVVERRLGMAIEPHEEGLWLERLGTIELENRERPAEAIAAWKRAAAIAEGPGGDVERAARLYERVLDVTPGDGDAAAKLFAIHRRAEAWRPLAKAYERRLAACDEDEVEALVIAFEEPAKKARVTSAFVAAADRALARETASAASKDALLAARARVLAADPARLADATAAYKRAIGAASGDATPLLFALDEMLANTRTERSRDDDRRWVFAWRVEHAAEEEERQRLRLAWAAAEETLMGDLRAATALLDRVLEESPDHDEALATSARLRLTMNDVDGALKAIAKRRDRSEGNARLSLDLELASLHEQFDRMPDAVEAAALAIEAAPGNPSAMAILKRGLEYPAARARAAEVIEAACEALDDPDRAAALYETLLATPPDAPELLAARGRWFERLLDQRQDDIEAALSLAVRAVKELPEQDALWERAEALALEASRADKLAEAYRDALLGPFAERLDEGAIEELGRRAVEYHEEWFDAPDVVATLLERVVKSASGAGWAFDRLKLEYASKEDWSALLGLYDRAIEREQDRERRAVVLEEAALAARDFAADPDRAIGYLEQLLPDGDRGSLVIPALERLYERTERHRPLFDLLARSLHATLAAEAPDREATAKLRARMATIALDGLGDADSAIEVVDAMIVDDPSSPDGFELLEKIVARGGAASASDDDAGRAHQRACSLLVSRYREAGRTKDLIRVLEGELSTAKDAADRAARLTEILSLYQALGDDKGALETLATLVTEAPEDENYRSQFKDLATRLTRRGRLAEVLAAAAERSSDGALRAALWAEAAAIYEGELEDASRAIDLRMKMLSVQEDADALETARRLDALLAEANRLEDRREVLDRLARIEADPAKRRAALGEVARLSIEELDDPARAVAAFERLLAIDERDSEALGGLIRGLEALDRVDELVSALERRVKLKTQEGGDARADRATRARLLGERLGRVDDAIRAWVLLRSELGEDDESADALSNLYEEAEAWTSLASLLESEAKRAQKSDRRAAYLTRLGDLHRDRTDRMGDAVAAYEAAIAADPAAAAAREGLAALVNSFDFKRIDEAESGPSMRAAVSALARSYAEVDDAGGLIGLLDVRLALAGDDAERAALLVETAGLVEQHEHDAAGAFDLLWRAFEMAPEAEAAGASVLRVATAAGRWEEVAKKLAHASGPTERAPAAIARDLWMRTGEWHRDVKEDHAAAEEAFLRALAHDEESVPLLTALCDVQRRAPSKALAKSLIALSEASGGDIDALSEAVSLASDTLDDPAFAESIAAQLLDVAEARWAGEGDAGDPFANAPVEDTWTPRLTTEEAAVFALSKLVAWRQAAGDTKGVIALHLRAATLPFSARERRDRRLSAAALAEVEEAISIYLELFLEDTRDVEVSKRLEALYREEGRRGDLLALRELQISSSAEIAERTTLRLDLARLQSEDGAPDRAIATLETSLAEAPTDRPTVALLADLLTAQSRFADLADTWQRVAEHEERSQTPGPARDAWAQVASIAEAHLDAARAIAAHRRAAALGRERSLGDLARLLIAAGDHEGAAEVLQELAEHASPEALPESALNVAEAWVAAGRPDKAIACLERARRTGSEPAALRDRLVALYRESGAFQPLAALFASEAERATDRIARVDRLRDAASLFAGELDQPAAAIPLLEEAAALCPDEGEVALALARALRRTARLEDARRVLRAILATYGARRPKERALVHHELSQVALAAGDRARAIGELDLALRIDPAHPEILADMAKLSLDEGQLDRAARSYRALLLVDARAREGAAKGPSRADVLFALSGIAEQKGEPDRTAELIESAFEAARVDLFELQQFAKTLREAGRAELLARAMTLTIEALRGLAGAAEGASETVDLEMQIGRAEQEAGDDRAAATTYRSVEQRLLAGASAEGASIDPRIAEVWRALEHVYARLGDTAAQAELLEQQAKAAASAYSSPADQADPLYRLAALRLATDGQQDEGAALLDRAFSIHPDAERAAAALRASIAKNPGNAAAISLFEQIARQSERPLWLVDALVLVAEGDPTRIDALREALAIANEEGDRTLAESIARRVLGSGEGASPPDAEVGWALLELSTLREANDDLAEAADLRERAARATPADRRALLLQVAEMARGALGDLPRAARLYEELRAEEPADRALWEPLLSVYRSMGDDARLDTLIRETVPLVDARGERCDLRLERSQILMRRAKSEEGDAPREEAIALLREALDEDRSHRAIGEMLSSLLEAEGRTDELTELLTTQLDAAKDREDTASVVSLSTRLGVLLEQRGDDDTALDVYHAALDWQPGSRDALRAVIRLSIKRDDSIDLGDALGSLLDVEQGKEAVDIALRLADLRRAHGDEKGAEQAIAKGYLACPESTALRDELLRRYVAREAWSELAEVHVADASTRKNDSEQVECLRRAAEVLRERAGNLARAADLFERALALSPADAAVLLPFVETCGALKQDERALGGVTAAIEARPEDPALYALRGSIFDRAGQHEEALADRERAYAEDGPSYGAFLIASLDRTIELAGDDRAREREARLRLVAVLRESGDLERARATLSDLVRKDGRDRAALRAAAELEDFAERWDASSAMYRRLLALEEGDALVDTALRLADACERGERLADARGALERALRVAKGREDVRMRLRQVYVATGAKRELAGLVLEDAGLASDVAGRFAHLLEAGRLLLESGEDFPRAASVLEEATVLCPSELAATLFLSDAYALSGRGAEAIALLAQAAAQHRGRRSKQLSAIHHRVARIQLASGDLSDSLASLVQAFDSDPQNVELAMELGAAAIDLDELDIATRAFRAITLVKPSANNAETLAPAAKAIAYYQLGRIAHAQGDARKARLMAEKALSEDQSLAVARDLLSLLREA